MTGANFLLIHIPGLIVLGIYIFGVKGTFPSFFTLFALGSLPFIAGDMFKIVIASLLGAAITPDKPYSM